MHPYPICAIQKNSGKGKGEVSGIVGEGSHLAAEECFAIQLPFPVLRLYLHQGAGRISFIKQDDSFLTAGSRTGSQGFLKIAGKERRWE